MKKLILPRSLLLYLLSILVFFVVGATVSAFAGAAEGQGLAGGAIIFMYGLMTAFAALIVAMIAVYHLSRETIIRCNQVMGILLLIAVIFMVIRVQQRKEEQNSPVPPEKEKTSLGYISPAELNITDRQADHPAGMGFFKPRMMENESLHFFGTYPFLDSSERIIATDSVTFGRAQYGDMQILSAPPSFAPHHMKLDYNILYMKVLSVDRNYLEVVVNQFSNQTTWISRQAGEYLPWPDFLLNVFSIEASDPADNPIRVKPLDHAGLVSARHEVLQPVRISGEWILVNLFDDQLEQVSSGWIRWKRGDRIMVDYSLLS